MRTRALPVFALTLACSPLRGTTPPSAAAATRDLLGGRPDAGVVVRLDRARNDPVYGPVLREQTRDPAVDAALATVDGVELWVLADGADLRHSSWVLAVHALPAARPVVPWWDPWQRHVPGARRLPSGAFELTTSVGGVLLALVGWPDGTLLAATGRAAPRLTERARRGDGPPPPTTWEREAIAAMYVGPRVLRLPDARAAKVGDGLVAAAAVVRTSAHGDLAFAVGYDTLAHAEAAHDLVAAERPRLEAARLEAARTCPPLAQLELAYQRDGRTLRGRIGHIPEVLVALRRGECERP
jgi:hypothetical protein